MLTCAGTLGFMLLLTKLPLARPLFGGSGDIYRAPNVRMSEPLPLITAHEVRTQRPQRPVELFHPAELLPESDFVAEELEEVDLDRAGINVPVAARLPEMIATTNLHDLTSTSRYMRTAITAPTVEEPPRLRIGSMLIEYPVAALKKAVQGLVVVRFMVETDGRAYSIDVVRGLEPSCDAAVVNALKDARFVPGRASGREVPTLSQMAIRFRIKGPSGYY